jgi:hypothetical protein
MASFPLPLETVAWEGIFKALQIISKKKSADYLLLQDHGSFGVRKET